jgi:ParB-like chromosome segregation protein Spo0J
MADTVATDVEMVAPAELVPYTNNPKEHPDEQVRKIASSIKNYGWDQPIVVDGDGEIIKGHGRLQAAELLGLDEVPVIRRTDLSDAEKRAARIADNKTAESPWDNDLLAPELDVLQEEDEIDIDTLGFDDAEIDGIIDSADLNIDELFDDGGSDTDDNADDTDTDAEVIECPDCGCEFEP